MHTQTISKDLLKKLGINILQSQACYPIVIDSNQEFFHKDPYTGNIVYQEVKLDYKQTLENYYNNKLKSITSVYDDNVTAQYPIPYSINVIPLTFFNPNVIPNLIYKDVTSQLLNTKIVGSYEAQNNTFQFNNLYCRVEPYIDYDSAHIVDIRNESVTLDQHRFEKKVKYDDINIDTSSIEGLELIANNQAILACVVANEHELINLYGVKGLATYGFLNYPHYPSSLNAKSVKLSNGTMSSKWEDKFNDAQSGAEYIANDVLDLFKSIQSNTNNSVSTSNSFILAVSIIDAAYLQALNRYGTSSLEIIQKTLPKLKVVVLNQLENSGSGRKVYLYPTYIKTQEVGTFAVSEKMSLSSLIKQPKSKLQIARAGTWGCIIKHPTAFGSLVVS